MSQPIIRVENLGKKYSIRHEHPERYTALRDVIAQKAKKLFSFPKHLRPELPVSDYEDFWALKDLNFEIQQGDRVGIIGRNGAGKSTLLKILSRITEPTTGRIELNGRVASLLEVGTGFHPELTGRENIFLNGAILGMSRAEIKSKFDEIVDFSGVEKFLDTPVKRYSSGMYVRLAFAVAAHLDPEILVVDEVLAVGDAEFQKKCLGKIEEVSMNEGRTILFVSHNMGTISSLCNIGVFIKNGKIQHFGLMQESIAKYNEASSLELNRISDIRWKGPIRDKLKFFSFKINNLELGIQEMQIKPSEKIIIQVKFSTSKELENFRLTFSLFNSGLRLFSLHDLEKAEPASSTTLISEFVVPNYLLRPGNYQIGFGGHENDDLSRWIWCDNIGSIIILEQWDPLIDPKNFGIINVTTENKRSSLGF